MFDEFQLLNLFSLSLLEIIKNLSVALLAGLILAWIFKQTYKGAGFASGFVSSIVLLTLITALVIMVIGNNLARAFGLVGAMSIIRFRTAVKDTMDIVFIFFSLAIGMAAGVGYHKLVFAGIVFIGATAYILSRSSFINPLKEEFLLQFSYTSDNGETPGYVDTIRKFCSSNKLVNVKASDVETGSLEIAYYVKLKNKKNTNEFIKSLKSVKGVEAVNIFFGDEAV